ncbi:MFS transporter [Streptomyces sp. NPDC059169]|uniref:MFS transporter n=1 Tax=unclassified Streptomyces TaxID=2593676 RepID=UPI0036AF6C11
MTTRQQQFLALAGSTTGAVIVALDGTVLTLAQPTMQRELHASFAQIQWTSTGYLIAVASLLVFAGRLGDRYGHQRVFAVGILGFAAASAAIGLADGISWVIGLRVTQGFFGALLQPATLGMLHAAYPPQRIGMPIALRTSAIGIAAASGPIVGGALTTHLGWRSVFFLGVAPALGAGLLALAVRVPAPPSTPVTGLDLPGACLLGTALVCLVHTLVGVPTGGWTTSTALGLVAAAASGAAFVRHERRTPHPLVPPDVLHAGAVGPALGVLVAASAALFGALFLATYHLQDVLALDPLATGLTMLPLAVTMVLGAPAAAVLMRRHGSRWTAVTGMVLLCLGLLLLSRQDEASTAAATGWCSLLLGAGFGTVMVTATAVIVQQASADTAGVAGGLQQTSMNVGPALGVAAAATLTAPATGAGPHSAAAAFTSAMGPALSVLAGVSLLGVLLATRLPGRTLRNATTHRPQAADLDPTARRRRAGVVSDGGDQTPSGG